MQPYPPEYDEEDYSECILLGTALKMGGDPERRDCSKEPCSKYCSLGLNQKLPKELDVKLNKYGFFSVIAYMG